MFSDIGFPSGRSHQVATQLPHTSRELGANTETMKQSPKWTLNTTDAKKWVKNTITFLAPLALMYIASITPLIQDGLALSDFKIQPLVAGGMVLYILNVVTDLLKKLQEGPKE